MKTNDIYDPLGIEIFAIEETFESVFNGLKGVYFRLYYKESKVPIPVRDKEKEAMYFKRYQEIGELKGSFVYNDWEGKRNAVETYSQELRKMIAIELNDNDH